MESKLEYILAFITFVFLILAFNIKIENKAKSSFDDKNNKTAKFDNLILYEINNTSQIYKLKAKSAIEQDKSWYLTKIIINNKEIKYLKSNSAIYNSKKITFKGNVEVLKKDGVKYISQKAIYNLEEKRLITPKKFKIYDNTKKVVGKDLIYDIKTKTTKAKDVNGTFKLKKFN